MELVNNCSNCKHLNKNYSHRENTATGKVTVYYCEAQNKFVKTSKSVPCEKWKELKEQMKLF